MPTNKRLLRILLITILVGSIALVIYLILHKTSSSAPDKLTLQHEKPTESPTTAFTPVIILPPGRQVYEFSNGQDVKGPKIKEVIIDPLDAKVGETQSLSIQANYPTAITSVSIELITDSQKQAYTLRKSSGKNTDGIWKTEWVLNDTTDHRYGLRLILSSATDTYDNTMWFRQ
jgi:hypothetical protein